MSDKISDFTGGLRGKLIEPTDSFADNVMNRIAMQREGSFRSMPVATRIVVSAIMIVLYCSLGVFLGAKSYDGLSSEADTASHKALVELMEFHHMDSDFLHDQLFRNLNSPN